MAITVPLVWLITGANSGLGLALAEYVLSQGHRVIAAARNLEKIPKTLKAAAPLQLDLHSTPVEIKAAGQRALEIYGHIDVLVNMAGYGLEAPVEELDPAELVAEFQTNFFGPIYLIQALLPSLRARRSGTIINVSSVAAFDGTPGYSAYSSSKAALTSMSDILQKELAPFNIRVLTLVPGYFHTSFMDNAAALGESTRVAAATPTSIAAIGKPPVTGAYPDVYGLARKIPTMRLKIRRVGDISKAVQRIYEIVTGTGVVATMENKPEGEWPLVLLGQDSGERVTNKIMGWKQCIEQSEEYWSSTETDPEKMEEMRKAFGIVD